MSSVWSSRSSSSSSPSAANEAMMLPLSSLVYESRAVAPLSDAELQRLLHAAQARNRGEGVTGLLIYDQGRFLQWLEGPTEALERVWGSVRQDPRHTEVTMVKQCTTPVRVFGDSAMVLGRRQGDRSGDAQFRSQIDLPAELVEALYSNPQALPSLLAGLVRPADETLRHFSPQLSAGGMSLQFAVDNVILPGLLAKHAKPVLPPFAIDPRAAELARLLLAAEPREAFALIDRLRADGRSITQLCAGLFEPAARALGDLWQADDCSEFEVTLGLGHLQVALHRVSDDTSSSDVPRLACASPHAVLVAASPHEPHVLGSVIASEMFWRAGWDVRCAFPDSDTALSQLVHDRWFDVLDLSLSGAFTRAHRLPALAATIRAVHAHSRNPALMVIVDGRVFHEQPQAGAEVGADASSSSALGVVSLALGQAQPAVQVDALAIPLPVAS
jgi:Sensors of blue-light using FAD